MNEQKFTQLLGGIDPALIARAEESVPMRKKPRFRRAIMAAVAALLAMALLLGAAAIAFIPKTYDLDYELPKHQNASQVEQIYYADQNGKIKRQSVLLPPTEQNVFMTWKHLCGLGDEMQMLDYSVQTEPLDGVQPLPNTLWDFLRGESAPTTQSTVTVTLSSQAAFCENNALIESLRQTLAKYAGVDPKQVNIQIDGAQTSPMLPLKFWHNLTDYTKLILAPGNRLDITVGMTNASDTPLTFTVTESDFYPDATLRHTTQGDKVSIYHELRPSTTDQPSKHTLAPGESREITYTFLVPEQATGGAYDLVVSFGGQSLIFYRLVSVLHVSSPVIRSISSAYQDFLMTYGFDATDPTAFKSAVQAQSYNGVGLFEIMNEADVEWTPGSGGEIFRSEQFTYTHSTLSEDGVILSHQNTFTATVLPDGMTLPLGISPEEGVIEALCKLGKSEQSARNALAQRTTCLIADSILSSTFVVTVSFDTTGIEISYKYGAHRVDICFDERGEQFELLRIQTKYTPADAGRQVVFTRFMGDDLVYTLTAQQSEQFSLMLERAEKSAGTIELECDSSGTVDGVPFDYDSATGVLLMDGYTYTLTEHDRIMLEFMLNGSVFMYFAPDATVEVDSPYDDLVHYATLSESHRDQIITILNGGEWKPGSPDMRPCDYSFTIFNPNASAKVTLHYSSEAGVFLFNDHYLRISNQDMNTVNEIFEGYAVQMPCA